MPSRGKSSRSENVKPQLMYTQKLPLPVLLNPHRSVFIFDRILLKSKKFKAWIEQFPYRYSVRSGEELKNIRHFPGHLEKIATTVAQIPERPLQVICCGGGSVGDFSGFVASILKRGVDLIQIPSTWLAAVDSAHGGKNALNVGRIKNQVGTFHFAKEVWLVKELLSSQPPERHEEALGEALKISMIEGGNLWAKFSKIKKWDAKPLWDLLPEFIEAKYKVVRRDPYEKKGIRHVLNLGHTVGHVLEAQLGLPHGRAVLLGLQFSLRWSEHRKILKDRSLLEISFLADKNACQKALRQVRSPAKHLSQDKKRVHSGKVRFVFIQNPGKPIVLPVTIGEILGEIKRQSV